LDLPPTAYAATGEFSNMCSWGLANHKDVATDCSVNTSIKGKTYCFSSQEAKSNFMKNPTANLAKAESRSLLRRRLLAWLCILAKPFGIPFSLVSGLIYVLANLCDVFVFTYGLYVDDETFPIGRADKPPTR
jgi:YHS domain-containing protein